MALSTRVTTPNGETIIPTVRVSPSSNILYKTAFLMHGNNTLGYIKYNIQDNKIFISFRENTSPYKGVGSALGEYVFRDSLRTGKGGCLENSSSYSAHIFHYKWGMRPISRLVWGNNYYKIGNLAFAYKTAKTEEEKNEIKNKIMGDKEYGYFKSIACNELSTDDISFDDVIREGFFNKCHYNGPYNCNLIENEIAEERKTGKRCITSHLFSISMYLPPEMIEKKLKEYSIDMLNPMPEGIEESQPEQKSALQTGTIFNNQPTAAIAPTLDLAFKFR